MDTASQEQRTMKHERFEMRKNFMQFFASKLEILTCFALITFVALLSEKVRSVAFVSWHIVFLPLYIVLALHLLFMVSYSFLEFFHSNEDRLEFYWNVRKIPGQRKTPTPFMLTHYHSIFGRLVTWALFLLGSIWIVLVAFYLESKPFPLHTIFIIPYILIGGMTIVSCAIPCVILCCYPPTEDNDSEWEITLANLLGKKQFILFKLTLQHLL